MTRTPEQIEALLAEARGMIEPVAWQRRIMAGYRTHTDDPGPWEECGRFEATDMFLRKPRYEYRPLFAASPTTLTALLEVVEQLRVENERMREALEPFVTNWADDYGWTKNACQNDRVVDWFGPSDFRLVVAALTDKDATHDNT